MAKINARENKVTFSKKEVEECVWGCDLQKVEKEDGSIVCFYTPEVTMVLVPEGDKLSGSVENWKQNAAQECFYYAAFEPGDDEEPEEYGYDYEESLSNWERNL